MPLNDPVPSTAFDVLERNSQDFDRFINSSQSEVELRGAPNGNVRIPSLVSAIKRIGYQPPVTYASGIDFLSASDNTKTISRPDDSNPTASIIYAPHPSNIPFTTSGTWGTPGSGDDQDKFFVVQRSTTSTVINYETAADLANEIPIPASDGDIVRVMDRGEYNLWRISTGTPDGYTSIDAANGNVANLIVDASKGVSLVATGVANGNTDNHLRIEAASALALSENSFVNPDHKDVCNLSETPVLSVPISSERPFRDVVFEQSDDSKSVLSFAANMDFFHMRNFTARYEDSTQTQTAPAILLTEENHNAKISGIYTLGGSYGVHSDQLSFWQSYENVRCDDYDLAQMRIDGDRNDNTGGGTTINITNCGGFNNNSNSADAALVLNSIAEVNIRTYESGQGNMGSLLIANNVFNLNIQSWHWELSEITNNAFDLSNSSLRIDGLYLQDIEIPLGDSNPIFRSFKSTVQVSNITKRGTDPDGTLTLLEGSEADLLNNSDSVIELSGSIDLDDFTLSGTYVDNKGVTQTITSAQVMRLDSPKVKIFNISSATPNEFLDFPFNGSKPSFIQITLGGTSQGVTPIINGEDARVTEVIGGSETTNVQFKYRWFDESGAVGSADRDIQIIAHYPKGWYALQ